MVRLSLSEPPTARPPSSDEKSPAEYGREALAQFRDAARYGREALRERKAAKGSWKAPAAKVGGMADGELGLLADAALARLGKNGKLAAELGVGRRVVNRLLPVPGADSEEVEEPDREEPDRQEPDREEPATPAPEAAPKAADRSADRHLFDASTPLPIQESIDVAVPVAAAFDVCTRPEELPRFSDRVASAAAADGAHLSLDARIGGRRRRLAIEIVGVEPEERIDWDGVEGIEHSGVLTFHPLAPRLTRIELSIEQDSEGLRERLARRLGLPERTVRQELRRFKAYAELWDEAGHHRSADLEDPATGTREER